MSLANEALQVQVKKAVCWPAPFFFGFFCRNSFDRDVGQFAAKWLAFLAMPGSTFPHCPTGCSYQVIGVFAVCAPLNHHGHQCASASNVTGLTVKGAGRCRQLYKDGRRVESKSLVQTCLDFVAWLQREVGEPALLVALNCFSFDMRVMINQFQLCEKLDELKLVIWWSQGLLSRCQLSARHCQNGSLTPSHHCLQRFLAANMMPMTPSQMCLPWRSWWQKLWTFHGCLKALHRSNQP